MKKKSVTVGSWLLGKMYTSKKKEPTGNNYGQIKIEQKLKIHRTRGGLKKNRQKKNVLKQMQVVSGGATGS